MKNYTGSDLGQDFRTFYSKEKKPVNRYELQRYTNEQAVLLLQRILHHGRRAAVLL